MKRACDECARVAHALGARVHERAGDVDGDAGGRPDDGTQHGAEQLVLRQDVRVEHLPRATPVRDGQRAGPRQSERDVEPAQRAARPRVGPRLTGGGRRLWTQGNGDTPPRAEGLDTRERGYTAAGGSGHKGTG